LVALEGTYVRRHLHRGWDTTERNGHARVSQSYRVGGYPLGSWVVAQRHFRAKGILDAEREGRLEEVTGWTWDPHADQWEEGLHCLSDYVKRHGDARVPKACTVDDGYRLGKWVQKQRVHHNKGTLEADREHRLKDLPGWTWDAYGEQWEEVFSRLLDYVKRHGNARLPRSCEVDGFRLGAWVTKQRRAHARGSLDAGRQQRLETLPGWTWDPVADQWEEGISRLLDYFKRHGDARVPRSCEVDGYRLGRWVNMRRVDHTRGGLDPDRERRLQELPGWTWDPLADMWEEGFRRVSDYVKRHGDARVPQSHTVDGYALGAWVMTQRHKHARGSLDAGRQRRLETLPGWTWDPRADQWEEVFRQLVRYVECHGDARVLASYTVDGDKLGSWVRTQRKAFTKGLLDADRQRRLQNLPGWTWKAR
jgi:helicase associated protein